MRSLLHGIKVVALSDVTNPLCGAQGSARVFGPQKGATRAQIRLLDDALRNWAWIVERDLGVSIEDARGGGAAGGLGAGLLSFCAATLVPGADWVLEKLGVREALARADLALWAMKAARLAVSGLASAVVLACGATAVHAFRFPDRGSLDADYSRRNEPGRLEVHIHALERLSLASEGPAQGEYLWRLCRAQVRRGEKRSKKAEKLADYDLARQNCEKAVALAAGSADAHFWYGVAMGRWGETKGLLKAMFLVKPIRREMVETLRLDWNHGGAHHVLGEMLWQIPGFAGGDKKKALAEFEAAVRLSPKYTANYLPLAEAYLHFGRKADAIKVLRFVAEVGEADDPAEYPEDLADASALLARLEGN